MPTNKNAQLRYQILDRCFSDFSRKYEIQDLVDKVSDALYDLYGTEVSLRQIREDIKYMRDRVTYNAPIKAYPLVGKRCYYRYEDRDFSIFNNELSVDDVNKLQSTIELYINFDEYIRQGEPQKKEKAEAWSVAIGLQAVDGLKTSEYLQQTARRNIEGEITIDEARELVKEYYIKKTAHNAGDEDKEEADRVSSNISKLLQTDAFTYSAAGLAAIHRAIFEGVFKHAGRFRDYDISKKEWVLRGDSVLYGRWQDLRMAIEYDLEQERQFSYIGLSKNQMVEHIARFVSGLWQTHPFREGNTRTTGIFTIKYLRMLGFNVNNELFANHSWYFRNALVRANYSNLQAGITETTVFLERFFRNMLLGETTPLRNREMHLDWKPEVERQSATNESQSAKELVQSAKSALLLPSKCKNCTLEEIAVLRVIQQEPTATQKQIAAEIGKSERTVKSITIRLTEQGILVRKNGKRNGYWEIVNE